MVDSITNIERSNLPTHQQLDWTNVPEHLCFCSKCPTKFHSPAKSSSMKEKYMYHMVSKEGCPNCGNHILWRMEEQRVIREFSNIDLKDLPQDVQKTIAEQHKRESESET